MTFKHLKTFVARHYLAVGVGDADDVDAVDVEVEAVDVVVGLQAKHLFSVTHHLSSC